MKILYLTAYNYPEQTPSSYLGKNRDDAFYAQGWETLTYTPIPSRGVNDTIRKEYSKVKKIQTLHNGHSKIIRFNLYREGKNPLLRALRYFILCIKLFNRGIFKKEVSDCNVMFVSSTPPIMGATAALVKKCRYIPFIYNLQDIFPDSLVGTGMAKKNGLLWKIGRKIEDFTYRNADKIIVISQDFKKNIMAKGVPEEKIEVIYNWVDEQAVVDVPRTENKLFDKYELDRSKFYITYCGNIGLTQNMDMLMDVAEEMATEIPNVHFVLIGDGADKARVVEMVKERNITNVTLLPFQPYENISDVFSLGDISIVISKPGVGENSVPSKTWSIMSASRPVLINFDENELKEIVVNHECGIFTKAGDKQSFKEAIKRLYENPSLCLIYGQNGRKFVMENLTKEGETQKYVDVIKSVVNN